MPFAPLNIPPGVIKPATPLQATGRYWDANLVRWRAGKLLPVGGWQRITEAPLGCAPRTIFTWSSDEQGQLAAIGCDDALFLLEGSTYTNVTPANFVDADTGQTGGYGAYNYGAELYGDDTDATYPRPPSALYIPSFSWSIDAWGDQILAVASSDGRLLSYTPGSAQAQVVGLRSISTIARASNVVTVTTSAPHDFSTGRTITIGGVTDTSFNGSFVIASVPSATTFTYAQTASDATSSGGTANLGVATNNRWVIVTPERHAVVLGYGGYPRRVAWSNREDYTDWDFSSTTNTAGFLDLETEGPIIAAVAVREGTLIWTQNEAFLMRFIGLPYVYSIEQVGQSCGLIAPRAFATTAGRCIWMGRQGFWIYDGGVVRPLPCDVGSSVFDGIDAASGALYTHGSDNNVFPEAWFWYPSDGSDVPDRYVIYNYAEGWWSVGLMTRTAACGAGVFTYPIAGDAAGVLYFHEDGWTNAGAPLATARYAETGALNLQSGSLISHLRQAITDSGYGYSSTALTVYGSLTPEGSETTFGPYAPRSDGYTDMRASGRDFRLRIASTQDADWSIGQIRIDFTGAGAR